MSKIQKEIKSDLIKAMRDKNESVVSVLRMLISAIHNKEISKRSTDGAELSDGQLIEIIKGEVKKRKDSITAYKKGNRQDLADKEEKEIEILEKYLPEQMSDEELEKIVRGIVDSVTNTSMNDFGKIMGQVMEKVKSRADGGQVSQVVKKILAEEN